MKKIFKFKIGQIWDGDEEICNFIEDKLLNCGEAGECPVVKDNLKVTIIIEKSLSKIRRSD